MPDLFSAAYEPFEASIPDGYPRFKFTPFHPEFNRKANVITSVGPSQGKQQHFVDLSIGECTCAKGFAWRFDPKKARDGKDPWYKASYCVHKMRMLARIVESSETTGEQRKILTQAYLAALATRYNPYELISAFHKELRRGDFKRAWFFGLIVMQKRGMRGLFKYLINIIYEETRDHELAAYLLKCSGSPRLQTFANAAKAINWFCVSLKKWQLPRRFAIFDSEMQGYRKLVKEFGRDVAKGSNIIAAPGAKEKLLKAMQDGARQHNLVQFQYGLKGLQKLRYFDSDKPDRDEVELEKHRYWLYERLYELGEELHGDSHDMWGVVAYVNDRVAAGLIIGYHEINAIGDALMGENATDGLLSPEAKMRVLARPTPAVPLYEWIPIPLRAMDNHTFAGKRLISKYPEQLKPGALQTDLDFRWCGAYFGLAWRMQSWQQFGEEAEWQNVKWNTTMYNTVNDLWY